MQQSAIVHFPKLPLRAAIAVVVISVISVTAAKLQGVPASPGFARAQAEQSRLISFADQPDGSILVTDSRTGGKIDRAAPGTNGFLRGSLRGLMRVRKISQREMAAPFILTRWSNGQLTLEDTMTKVKIDLLAYGPTNAAVYEQFLTGSKGADQ